MLIELRLDSVEEVAQDVFNRIVIFDKQAETEYSKDFHKGKIEQIIRKSPEEIKDTSGKVSESKRNQTLVAFSIIRRKGEKNL